ncbi:MAG: lipoate--protein ligase family protein [Candidatus Omnitrophota bacterium]
MQFINHICKTPEENIALDEVLLKKAEKGEIGETIRFWESVDYFVVIGRAGKIREECLLTECREAGIKIIRRISGGGTVLQGPGCLNYSLVISYDRDKRYRDIRGSFQAILGPISEKIRKQGYNVCICPVSDIALDNKKISGNAQARKKKYFLHHGTFLYDFDIAKISQYLSHPGKEPEYRNKRKHHDFLVNLTISVQTIKQVIKDLFLQVDNSYLLDLKDLQEVKDLVASKYLSDKWNYEK